jgi:hypothetical protein
VTARGTLVPRATVTTLIQALPRGCFEADGLREAGVETDARHAILCVDHEPDGDDRRGVYFGCGTMRM